MTISGKKFLLWSIILFLILACAPAAVTPIPTLDPNTLGTIIAQTASSASTQTAAAMPISIASPTSAPTFTPEPTFSPVPLIVLSSPTTVPRIQYFRVKHDFQLALYDYESRTAADSWGGGAQTPEIAPLFLDAKVSSGTNRTIVDGNWEIYINALNNHDAKKLRFLKAGDTALFNGAGFPQLESLTMGGNIITLDAIQSGWGRVKTIDYVNPGALKEVDYMTRPDLVHKVVVVGWSRGSKSSYLAPPPQGAVYWPLVSSRPVWIQMERLEAFPFFPMDVVAKKTQKILKRPEVGSSSIGREIKVGETARVMEYYPSGPNVWGKLQDGGWIALLLHLEYPTSWSMSTVPPP